MVEEVISVTSTSDGGADGGADGAVGTELSELLEQTEGNTRILTSSQCGGCGAAFLRPSSSQSGSDSDRILSSLL